MQAGRRLNELNLSITRINQELSAYGVRPEISLLELKDQSREIPEKDQSDIVVGEDEREQVHRKMDKKSKLVLAVLVLYPILVSIFVATAVVLVVVGTSLFMLLAGLTLLSFCVKDEDKSCKVAIPMSEFKTPAPASLVAVASQQQRPDRE